MTCIFLIDSAFIDMREEELGPMHVTCVLESVYVSNLWGTI